MKTEPQVIDQEVDFDEDHSTGHVIIKRHQYIPDDFIAALKAGKMDSVNKRSGEMMHTMCIPVAVIEDIKRLYDFDAMEQPQHRTAAMLRKLGMDAFIVTNKSF